MFNDLKAAWITEVYKSYKAILIPSMSKQLSTVGVILDLDSLPTKPYPFKELFIRWLISINKERLANNQQVIINRAIILACPLWRIVKCPLRKMTLTKEGMFNRPTSSKGSIGSIGSVGPIGSINR